jgi:hypothetical protein
MSIGVAGRSIPRWNWPRAGLSCGGQSGRKEQYTPPLPSPDASNPGVAAFSAALLTLPIVTVFFAVFWLFPIVPCITVP